MTPPPTLPRPIHLATEKVQERGSGNLLHECSWAMSPSYKVVDLIDAASNIAAMSHNIGARGSFERSTASFPEEYSSTEKRICLLAAEDAVKAYDAIRPVEEIIWLLRERMRGQNTFLTVTIDVRDERSPEDDEIEQ